MERGWALNIGGGFHHCHSVNGGGFCAYADITLCVRFLFELNSSVKTAMIVDLDAHQVSERVLKRKEVFSSTTSGFRETVTSEISWAKITCTSWMCTTEAFIREITKLRKQFDRKWSSHIIHRMTCIWIL